MCKCVGEDVSCGDVDGLLEEIVFQDDEAGVQLGCVTKDIFPVLKDLSNGD